MKRCVQEEHSPFFPFTDGEDESSPIEPRFIHEATSANGLRELIIAMTGPQSPYVTLAWGAAAQPTTYLSYVEFTFRDRRFASDPMLPHRLELLFRSWIIEAASCGEGLAHALLEALAWKYRTHARRDKGENFAITLFARADSERDHARLISWPATFLLNIFAPTLPS